MNFWRIFKGLLTLAIIGGLGYGGWYVRKEQSKEAPLPTTKVTKENLSIRTTISGMVEPKRSTWIVAPYNGYVKKLFVGIGDKIEAGQPVVTVSPETGAGADETFPLRSPFSGVVMDVASREGEIVTDLSNSPRKRAVLRIDDTSTLFVNAIAPEIEYPKLKIGQIVEVKATALPDRIYHGRIESIAQAAQEQDRWEKSKVEFGLRARITDADAKLRPGMSVVMDVIVAEAKNAIALRHEYIEKEKSNYFVTLGNGERKQITLGLQNDEFAEVKSGLKEADDVRMVDFLAVSRKVDGKGKPL